MTGDVEQAVLRYIVRDHNKETFEQRKAFLKKVSTCVRKFLLWMKCRKFPDWA